MYIVCVYVHVYLCVLVCGVWICRMAYTGTCTCMYVHVIVTSWFLQLHVRTCMYMYRSCNSSSNTMKDNDTILFSAWIFLACFFFFFFFFFFCECLVGFPGDLYIHVHAQKSSGQQSTPVDVIFPIASGNESKSCFPPLCIYHPYNNILLQTKL